MSRYVDDERAGLADELLKVGPDAPTLCEGWDTRDLAAHLVIRERRADAGIGLVFKPLYAHMERVRVATRDKHSYEELVELFRTGPPFVSPIKLPALDALTNTIEYFVHHEDVRRGEPGWKPRELDAGLEEYLGNRLSGGAKLFMRGVPLTVRLKWNGHETTVGKGTEPTVTISGQASELMLVAYGRGKAVDVQTEGDPADVTAVLSGKYGI